MAVSDPSETAYAFLKATTELTAELRANREEMRKLRTTLEEHGKAVDDNSDLLHAFGDLVHRLADRVNVVRGLGNALGSLLGGRRRRE